jgi:hypothetical protein
MSCEELIAYKEKDAACHRKVRFCVPFPSPRAPRFRSFAPHAPFPASLRPCRRTCPWWATSSPRSRRRRRRATGRCVFAFLSLHPAPRAFARLNLTRAHSRPPSPAPQQYRAKKVGDELTAFKEKKAARSREVRFRVTFPSPRAPRFRSFEPHARSLPPALPCAPTVPREEGGRRAHRVQEEERGAPPEGAFARSFPFTPRPALSLVCTSRALTPARPPLRPNSTARRRRRRRRRGTSRGRLTRRRS